MLWRDRRARDLVTYPRSPFEINRASQQAQGLILWWPPLASHGLNTIRDLSGNGKDGVFGGTSANPAYIAYRDFGWGLRHDRSDQTNADVALSLASNGDPFTMVMWMAHLEARSGSTLLRWKGGAGGEHYFRTPAANRIQHRVTFTDFSNDTISDADTFATGVIFHVVGVWEGTNGTHYLYVNGVEDGSSTPAAGKISYAQSTLEVNRNDGFGMDFIHGDIRIYNRALSANEVWALYDPATRWDLYLPVRKIWPVTTGVVSYTLTADAGSYTITGTAANPEYHRVLSADAGSYTHTGTAANLEIGYVVSADAGSYAVSGTEANLEYHRVISIDAGSYTLTGTAADLYFGYSLSAEGGSYAVTGTDASLEYARIMAADAGSYTLTGTAATLLFGYTMSAEGGSYSVIGTAAGVIYDRVISIDAGAYTYTGTAATLTYGQVTVIGDVVVSDSAYYEVTLSDSAYYDVRISDAAR